MAAPPGDTVMTSPSPTSGDAHARRLDIAFAGLLYLATAVVFDARAGWFGMQGGTGYPACWSITRAGLAFTGPGRFALD